MKIVQFDTEARRCAVTASGQSDITLAHYPEATTGCTFVIARPADAPFLWREYLRGAFETYSRFGVEAVLDLDAVQDGSTTSFFFAALDDLGNVVGGTRVQGPYRFAYEAHAMAEWNERSGSVILAEQIAERIDDGGVIEVKTAWASDRGLQREELSAAVARTFMLAVEVADVGYALCTGAEHAIPRWRSVGGQIASAVGAVPYPDRRYRTVPMWWDRRQMCHIADAWQHHLFLREMRNINGLTLANAQAVAAVA